jgi:hypothetical protein
MYFEAKSFKKFSARIPGSLWVWVSDHSFLEFENVQTVGRGSPKYYMVCYY